MIVNPKGVVKLLKNIGWHSDLKHTRLFATEDAQLTYMASRVAHTFTENFTYVREQKVLRVPIRADDIYNCNYLMFKNVGFGDKWFYAFITDMKYVNPETTELTFEIDMFQTWWFQIRLGKCFVEREHVADDSIGKHTVDEGLDLGEHLIQNKYDYLFGMSGAVNTRWKIKLVTKPSIMTQAIMNMGVSPTQMGDWNIRHAENQYMLDTTYSSEMYNQDSTISLLVKFLNDHSDLGEELISVECYPAFFEDANANILKLNTDGILRPAKFNIPNTEGNFEYTPVNNKMYCYPYMFLRVTNHEDGYSDFRWENFDNADDPTFLFSHVLANKVGCLMQAMGYMNQLVCREGELWLNDFPTIPIAQNDMKNTIKSIGSLVGNVLGAGLSVATGNVGGAISAGVGAVSNAYSAMTTPSKIVGSPNKNLALKNELMGYSFYCMCIRPEYAKMIDDFFTRFGYKVNQYKVPELTSRQSFNYIKTKECDPSGDAPDEALKTVADMFNSGVTLWHVNDVGNTSLANDIV